MAAHAAFPLRPPDAIKIKIRIKIKNCANAHPGRRPFQLKKQRIIVMGFMAGIPIAGVVWQHLQYIVGLQRLGHEVYYFEDSARYTYNPETWETLPDYEYAVKMLCDLAKR